MIRIERCSRSGRNGGGRIVFLYGCNLICVRFSLGSDARFICCNPLSAVLLVLSGIFTEPALSCKRLLRPWQSLASSVGVAVGVATIIGVEVSGRLLETSHWRLTTLKFDGIEGCKVLLAHVIVVGVGVAADGSDRVFLRSSWMTSNS